MKFFNNPFTAPDIQDILRERKLSFRNLVIVFGSGIVLASTLIGGYHIGEWFIGHTVAPVSAPPVEVITESDESSVVPPSVEERQAMLARLQASASSTPKDVSPKDREARLEWAGQVEEPSVDERNAMLKAIR